VRPDHRVPLEALGVGARESADRRSCAHACERRVRSREPDPEDPWSAVELPPRRPDVDEVYDGSPCLVLAWGGSVGLAFLFGVALGWLLSR